MKTIVARGGLVVLVYSDVCVDSLTTRPRVVQIHAANTALLQDRNICIGIIHGKRSLLEDS